MMMRKKNLGRVNPSGGGGGDKVRGADYTAVVGCGSAVWKYSASMSKGG